MTGTRLLFATGPSSLGTVLVARTDAGICCILLGDSASELAADLEQRFPRAALQEDPTALRAPLEQIAAFLADPSVGLDLPPLDLHGTAFQQQVWLALQAIPLGTTLTYTDLARQIGRPAAVRAVAGACAANPAALAVPCHRVLRSTGGLSGYRWGVERKRILLQREARLLFPVHLPETNAAMNAHPDAR